VNARYLVIIVSTTFALSASLASCNLALRTIYGISTKVTYKEPSDLAAFIVKHKYDNNNQYYVDPSGLKKLLAMSESPNSLFVFSEKGQWLKIDTSKKYCSGTYTNHFARIFNQNASMMIDSSIVLDTILNHCFPIMRSTVKETKPKYYVILTWASFMGRFNKTNYQKWSQELLLIQRKYELEIINISLDFKAGYDYSILSKSASNK
jgi:hypothetical protein